MHILNKFFLILIIIYNNILATVWRPSDGIIEQSTTLSSTIMSHPRTYSNHNFNNGDGFAISFCIGMTIYFICEKIYDFIKNRLYLSSLNKYPKPQNTFYTDAELSRINTAAEIIKNKLPLPGKILVAHNEKQASNGVTTCIFEIASKASAGIIHLSSILDPKIQQIDTMAQQYVNFKSNPLIIFLDNMRKPGVYCDSPIVSKNIAAISSAANIHGVYFAIGTDTFDTIKKIFLNEGRPGFEIKMENPTAENIKNMLRSNLPKNTSSQKICELSAAATGLCRATIINSTVDSATATILKLPKKVSISKKTSTKKLITMATSGKNNNEFYDRLLMCFQSKQKIGGPVFNPNISAWQEDGKTKNIFYQFQPTACNTQKINYT